MPSFAADIMSTMAVPTLSSSHYSPSKYIQTIVFQPVSLGQVLLSRAAGDDMIM